MIVIAGVRLSISEATSCAKEAKRRGITIEQHVREIDLRRREEKRECCEVLAGKALAAGRSFTFFEHPPYLGDHQ